MDLFAFAGDFLEANDRKLLVQRSNLHVHTLFGEGL